MITNTSPIQCVFTDKLANENLNSIAFIFVFHSKSMMNASTSYIYHWIRLPRLLSWQLGYASGVCSNPVEGITKDCQHIQVYNNNNTLFRKQIQLIGLYNLYI
jgi:hypothetical protein